MVSDLSHTPVVMVAIDVTCFLRCGLRLKKHHEHFCVRNEERLIKQVSLEHVIQYSTTMAAV